MADRVGQQFGNYRLLRLIGHGGFADVYLGEHIYIGTQAAIKVLHTHLGSKEVERFRQEASMVARLEHPHIVRVLDFGVEETVPFLVMSYAPNGTLRERHPRGTVLPLPTILDYVKQIADALQYAHNEKIIHRDVKPENMLLGRRNEILLSDFGIALISQNSYSQSAKDLAGTAAYMAPEQLDAHPRASSDQYALGVVVYEWLSGSCPFSGTFTEIALKHAAAPPPSLRTKIPGFSPEIEQVVFTALAKDPAKRFASIQACARALEQACLTVTPPADTSDTPTILFAEDARPMGGAESANKVSLTPPAVPVVPQQPSKASPLETPVRIGEADQIPPLMAPPITGSSPNSTILSQTGEEWLGSSPRNNQGIVTPFLGLDAPLPVSDVPPPLRRYPFSKGVLALLAVLVFLLVGGGILGTLRFFSSPATHIPSTPTTNPLDQKARQTAIVTIQENHDQEVSAYNQNVTTNGIMFGFDAQHTHVNPYEGILGAQNIARVQKLWSAPLGSPILFSSPVLANGVVYVGTRGGKLYAFDAVSGRQKWVVAIKGNAAIYSSPAVANGMVYIGATDHKVYAFDASTGDQKWFFRTGDQISSSPVVANGVVYIGSFDRNLYALDAMTGKRKWAFPTGSTISYSSPAVANGIVYIGVYRYVFAIDAITGHQKWLGKTGNIVYSSPTIANNVVYIGSYDHQLYAFDAVTGNRKWAVPTGNKIFSSPAVANGTVYVGSLDGKLYAFDVSTGQQKWVKTTGDAIEASPLVANGLVYAGSWDHKLYAFDAATGQQKWSFPTGDQIYSSPMVANGIVYFASSDGKLYAFSLLKE